MKKIRLIITIVIVTVSTATIFYACQKENTILKRNDSGLKSRALENPFNICGKAHNAALDALARNENYPDMTGEEVWDAMKPVFEGHFGTDYRHLRYDVVNEFYNDVEARLNAKNLVSTVDELAELGFLNKEFSADVITRNNYEILYDYWYKIESMLHSPDEINYEEYQELTVQTEQEIISNYYALTNTGIATREVLKEYRSALSAASVATMSCYYWNPAQDTWNRIAIGNDAMRQAEYTAADGFAYIRGLMHYDYYTSSALATAASERRTGLR